MYSPQRTGNCAPSAGPEAGGQVVQVGKDAVVIEADAIKNRDAMYKHLSSSDFTKHDPMLSSYVHEYSTKAAEMLLAAAGDSLPSPPTQPTPVLYQPA